MHTFCGQQVRKELVLETVYDERKYEGSAELTTLFSACISSFLKITDGKNYYKIRIILAGSFQRTAVSM